MEPLLKCLVSLTGDVEGIGGMETKDGRGVNKDFKDC